MIYKVTLEDGDVMHNNGCMYIVQNETHVLYQHPDGESIPNSVTVLETHNDSELVNLYAADEWQQPTGDN